MRYEIQLLGKLVSFDTNSDEKSNYSAFCKFLVKHAKKQGFKVRQINAKAPDKKPRPNLVIDLNAGKKPFLPLQKSLGKKGTKQTLILATHYDVVPAGEGWFSNPFKMVKKGNAVFGRGVNDDKGAIAACLGAMKELKGKKLKRNVRLIVACDEEVGGEFGVKFLAKKHRRLFRDSVALIVDSSKLQHVGIGCSGVGWAYLHIKGKQGHAAYPHKTENVLHKAIPFLNDLLKFKALREKHVSKIAAPADAPKRKVWGRFAITILQAGVKTNVFPPKLTVGIDLRALPEEKSAKVLREFKRFAKKLAKKHKLNFSFEAKASDGYFVNAKIPFVKEVQKVAEKAMRKKLPLAAGLGGTDGRFIAKLGIPTIEFGPGGKTAHGANESITIAELQKTKEVVKLLAV